MTISKIGQNYANIMLQQQPRHGSSAKRSLLQDRKDALSYMAEVASAAMDAMGVRKNERVTYNQINKYKSKMEKEYGAELKNGLKNIGVAADAAFTISVGANGKVTVDSGGNDKSEIQKFFDDNPSYGKKIREDLKALGLDASTPVRFKVSANGSLAMATPKKDTDYDKTIEYLKKNNYGTGLKKDLAKAGIDENISFDLELDDKGRLLVSSSHPDKDKLRKFFDDDPSHSEKLRNSLKEAGLNASPPIRFSVGADGAIAAMAPKEDPKDAKIFEYLTKNDYGTVFKRELAKTRVDEDIKFNLKLDGKGRLLISSSHPDKDKVQKFFDDNPELAEKYNKIQALADLEEARKAMGSSPAAIRKRIEVESMAVWWENSGNAATGIGEFSDGSMSLLPGLNARV